MAFLLAEWRKLAIANYRIDPAILRPYLPALTELDFWQGECLVSLVGFRFLNTRVRGWKVPFHVNFDEVNLRFYVRHHTGGIWKRGVVFIKEIVSKPAIAFVANALYKEHYETLPMRHAWEITAERQRIEYAWKKAGHWQRFGVEASSQALDMTPGSDVEFITEHYWGYARHDAHRTVEYEVRHPRWQHYPVLKSQIEVDFGKVYGTEFSALTQSQPHSVMLAEGSAITVESRKILTTG